VIKNSLKYTNYIAGKPLEPNLPNKRDVTNLQGKITCAKTQIIFTKVLNGAA
jgi:hypothetical protein